MSEKGNLAEWTNFIERVAEAPTADGFETLLCEGLRQMRRRLRKSYRCQVLESLLAKISEAGAPEQQAVAGYVRCVILFDGGRYRRCNQTVHDVLQHPVNAAWWPELEKSLLARRALYYWQAGLYRELQKVALPLAEGSANSVRIRVEAMFAVAMAHYRLRDPVGCQEFLRRCTTVAKDLGRIPGALATTGLNLFIGWAMLKLLNGDLPRAERFCRRASQVCFQLGLPREQAYARAQLARIRYYMGNRELARRNVDEAETLARDTDAAHVSVMCDMLKSQYLLRRAVAVETCETVSDAEREQGTRLRHEAIEVARRAERTAREELEIEREKFRQLRNLAEVVGCACPTGVQSAESVRAFEDAHKLLERAERFAGRLRSDEPFAPALLDLTSAVVHDHHGDVATAQLLYEKSLSALRPYVSGYRQLSLLLRFGTFLCRHAQAPADRFRGLALLCSGRAAAAAQGYERLTEGFNQQLETASWADFVGALGQMCPEAARSDEYETARNHLLAGLIHDLKNNLYTLREALDGGREAAPGDEGLTGLCDHARGLVRWLNDVAKTGAVPEFRERELFQLKPLVEDCCRRQFSRAACGCFANDIPADLQIVGHSRLIAQALENLLHNAIKAARAGNMSDLNVTVSAQARGEWMLISVDDNAGGMDQNTQKGLFSWDTSVGTAFAEWVTRFHGGSLVLESSTQGQGSRFVMHLPARSPRGA
jgi:signal transduction histidine kinase